MRQGPIILISIDTLRADHLPLYGYTAGRTPAIDALARDAVVFDAAYAHAPQTLPSHLSILSGLLPFEHGVRDNIGFTLKPGTRMLQDYLHGRGYTTAGFVSAYVIRKETGIGRGFDDFDSQLPPASPEKSLGQVQRRGEDTLAVAERWLSGTRTNRFFLFFHIYEPHKPYSPPARFASMAPYDGEISYSDEIVGRLVDDLKSRGLYDPSTIVLLADHGEGLGDHVEQEHGLFIYNETIRVPLVVKLPYGAHGGRRIATPVQHIDLVPTLLEIAGAPRPSGLRGRSLVPLLEDRGSITPEGIYSEALYPRYHFGWSELLSLTDERYKYIRAPHPELYDLERDPHERQNLAPAREQVARVMRSALSSLASAAPLHTPGEVSAEDRMRLAALGYVGTQTALDTTTPAERLPDPKDKADILEKYRKATDLAGDLRFAESAAVFRELVAEDPGMTDVWEQYAQVLGRLGDTEGALHAYQEVLKRDPTNSGALVAASSALRMLGRLDEAQAHAELAVKSAPAAAHEALARVALERKNEPLAEREASLAHAADPSLPMPDFVRGVFRYNEGKYAEALPYLQAAAQALRGRTLQINDLHYYIGDSLARLGRYAEAEPQFLEEIRVFPQNPRPRAGLAMLYRAAERDADSERVITEMLRVCPTPEGYKLAANLWTMFGDPAKAAALRAEAARRFRKIRNKK